MLISVQQAIQSKASSGVEKLLGFMPAYETDTDAGVLFSICKVDDLNNVKCGCAFQAPMKLREAVFAKLSTIPRLTLSGPYLKSFIHNGNIYSKSEFKSLIKSTNEK